MPTGSYWFPVGDQLVLIEAGRDQPLGRRGAPIPREKLTFEISWNDDDDDDQLGPIG